MLSPDRITVNDMTETDGRDAPGGPIDFEIALSIARRQWRIVAVAIAVALVTGMIYSLTAVPYYTAKATVLIDRSKGDVVNQLSPIGSMVDDEASVLSQVEVVQSETIAAAVVDRLRLATNPLFATQQASLSRQIRQTLAHLFNPSAWFSGETAIEDEAVRARLRAIETVRDDMRVSRLGRTYVLSIGYTSRDADTSAAVANGIAEAYLLDKLNSKYDATRRASDWLLERIDELKHKALDSDLAVQRFRNGNGLVSAGGMLISDQQLSELNSQLIILRTDTARARARYARIKAIIDSGRTDAIVDDVLESSISNELRGKYLEASKLEAEISNRLGRNHVQAVRLRNEMAEFQRLMFEELGRIAESYQSDVEVSETRETALEESVRSAQGVSAIAGETQVQLRELERTADTYKNLYQTFLQRYQEAIQQQSFPITDARVISQAGTPDRPSAPRMPLVLAFSVLLGAAVGAGAGAVREFRDRFFRTGEQVRRELGVEFIGMAPLVAVSTASAPPADEHHPRRIRRTASIGRHVVDHPMSMFAETLRSAKIAIDLDAPGSRGKVVGIISTLPSEGKSTIAVNFASLLALQGARVLLIDADLRNPGATRAIARHAEAGLVEALTEDRDIKDLLLFDPATRMAFLPAVVTRRVPHSSELLASPAMAAIIQRARANFSYIVLDLPPLLPVVDARAVAPRIDSFLYVVEWGRTSRKVVRGALHGDAEIFGKCAGAILNKVDEEKMKLYRAYGSSEYYASRYATYYQEG